MPVQRTPPPPDSLDFPGFETADRPIWKAIFRFSQIDNLFLNVALKKFSEQAVIIPNIDGMGGRTSTPEERLKAAELLKKYEHWANPLGVAFSKFEQSFRDRLIEFLNYP